MDTTWKTFVSGIWTEKRGRNELPYVLCAGNKKDARLYINTNLMMSITINEQNVLMISGVASYGALGHVPPRLPAISFLVHFGVNLTANYLSIV